MPNIFLFFFIFFVSMLLAAKHLSPPLCVILHSFIICIRVLLLYVSKITNIYFSFFIRLDNVYFCLLMVAR